MRSLRPQHEQRGDKPPDLELWHKRRLTRVLAIAGLVGGSALTIGTLLNLPQDATPSTVSGSPRLKLTDAGEFVRWRKHTTELTIDPSFEQLGAGTRDVVALAYATWSSERAHLPALTIDLPGAPRRAERDGVNLVTYGPIELAGHQQSLGVTIAYVLPDGTIAEVDTIINSRKPFQLITERDMMEEPVDLRAADGDHDGYDHDDDRDRDRRGHDDSDDRGHDDHDDPSADGQHSNDGGQINDQCVQSYDLQSVLAHEAGHFFGLGEDEENREATMYYKTSRCETKQRDLSDDDVAAVETVYAEPAPAEQARQAAACTIGRGVGARPIVWVILALVGALAAVRRGGARSTPAQARAPGCPSK